MPTYLIIKPPTHELIPPHLSQQAAFSVPYYIDSDQVELLSHDPLWDIGMTKPVDSSAINGSVEYEVPLSTKSIKVVNGSNLTITLYNHTSSNGLPVLPDTTIVIPDVHRKMQVLRITVDGTIAPDVVWVYYNG